MLRMQVYLPEELYLSLKSRAVIEDLSMSDLVRKGLEKVLSTDQRKSDPMKKFVGQCKKRTKTNSVEEINNYYKKIAR